WLRGMADDADGERARRSCDEQRRDRLPNNRRDHHLPNPRAPERFADLCVDEGRRLVLRPARQLHTPPQHPRGGRLHQAAVGLAMARYEDAAAGWTIFREHHGHITLEELNQMLRAQGRRPVAKRTFNHYRKLYRLGYEEYVSINRLDLRHASGSVFDIA